MQTNSNKINTIQPIYAKMIFLVGLACMIVAGYFLIEGLSQFAGTSETRNVLIIGGILFQITESLCFIAASSLTFHSVTWRITLFSLGIVLFIFSIGVMTLAQKTALQSGINEASAIDERRGHIRSQIESLDRMITSYRFNAEKQSRSIFKDSRALGQDSINRATDIEQKKIDLSNQLFNLNQTRRETSVDFFNRLEEVTGLPAQATEFYFLVIRSLLIELCGILFMAFGASLHALHRQNFPTNDHGGDDDSGGAGRVVPTSLPIFNFGKDLLSQRKKKKLDQVNEQAEMELKRDKLIQSSKIIATDTANATANKQEFDYIDENIEYDDAAEDQSILEDAPNTIAIDKQHTFSKYIDRLKQTDNTKPNGNDLGSIAKTVFDMYKRGDIRSLSRDNIIKALRIESNIKIGSTRATEIKKYIDLNYKNA